MLQIVIVSPSVGGRTNRSLLWLVETLRCRFGWLPEESDWIPPGAYTRCCNHGIGVTKLLAEYNILWGIYQNRYGNWIISSVLTSPNCIVVALLFCPILSSTFLLACIYDKTPLFTYIICDALNHSEQEGQEQEYRSASPVRMDCPRYKNPKLKREGKEK